MDLRGQEIKNTYGNVVTIGSSAGSPTTGELTNGQNSSFTSTYLGGNFGIGSAPTTYGSLNVLALGSAGSAAGGIIDIVGTSGRLASIYTEASGKLVLTADPTNGEAGTSMEFNVDGSNAMFIDSSRNVGIGLVLPTELLHVAGNLKLSDGADRSIKGPANANLIISNNASSSSQGIKFSTDGGTTTDVFIQDGGNVGIGTASPASKFIVKGSGTSPIVYFGNGVDNAPNRQLAFSGGSSGLVWDLDATGASGVGGQLTLSTNGSERMRIDSSGNVGIGTSSLFGKFNLADASNARLEITPVADGVSFEVLDSARANPLDFKVFGNDITFNTKVSGSYSERLRIDSSGNVGIGTNNPNAILDIQDANPQIQFTDSVNTSAYSRILGTDTGSLYIDSDYGNAGASSNIIFRIDGGSEKMRITATGNVGINTSAPDSLFHIQNLDGGSYRFGYGGTSDVYIDSDNVYYRSDAGGSNYMALISGNVGIGTTTPETKLDVDGDIQTAAPETSTNAAWKLGNVGLGGVEVGPIDYITVSVGGFVVKLPIAIFPETQAFYDRVIADGGTFEGLLGYESAVTILKAQ